MADAGACTAGSLEILLLRPWEGGREGGGCADGEVWLGRGGGMLVEKLVLKSALKH